MFSRLAVFTVALCSMLLVGMGPAHAAPAVLGGGSGIIIDGEFECTLTTIGHDNAGRLVGITAGHCGNGGSQVVSESNQSAGTVGTFDYTNSDLDYAVITFNPSAVVPVNRIGNTTITGIGGPPQFGNIVCKQGRTTGSTCGLDYGDVFGAGTETYSQMCVIEGDSGSPVVNGTTLVAMVNAYLLVACLGPEVGTNIASIIGDINARGGVGAGFRPI
ncbi:serine protease [Skermania sp. ID1734]|uniref:serine protease n=1 Tax=Skermania sp. ID1734 TaxID=2597516 RepID=UPI00117DF38E|nr:serine protease [Skermania sp. ID1734]TSE01549.1 serine protease [Skermania sp. ID1734]